jgi:alpha-1,2-mannosyltransferase
MHAPLSPRRGLEPRVDARTELYAKLTFASGLLFLGFGAAYYLSAPVVSLVKPSFDIYGFALGRDFMNTWMGGRSAFSGGPAPWFDFTAYNAFLREFTGHPDFPLHFWSYPPHLILFVWPLGLLPYLPAYAVWCLAGLALYWVAARSGGVERKHMLFAVLAPAVAVNVLGGQNGFFTAALLIGGLTNLDRRPIVSGILFAMLTVKPQFGLLVPVLLLLTRRWRVAAAAAITVALLAAVTSVWFGPAVWLEFFREVMPQQHQLMHEAGTMGWPIVLSAFVNARLVGLPETAAWWVQGAVSCSAFATVVWTFWRKRDAVLSLALFVTATVLFSPWMLNYDMVVFGWLLALLRQRPDNTALDDGLAIAVWTLPGAMLLLGSFDIPIAMLVMPAFAGRLLWRLAHETTQRAVDDGARGGVEEAAEMTPVSIAGLAAQ